MNDRKRAGQLRAAISRPDRPAVIVGAHNPVAASFIEDAGFDGIWISSLEMSLMHGIDDRNLLGLHEIAESIHYIRSATRLPIVVDADNGYGSVEATARAVYEYEAMGANGICIEDSSFPKVNSFATGGGLLDVREHERRIRAAKESQSDPDFLVIARTETLIRGGSIEEAVERSRAYCAAGADIALMHSKVRSGQEALSAAAAWDGKVALATVPTAFPQLTLSQLGEAGFSLVIYANQLLRASLQAIQEVLGRLRREPVEDSCMPMGDLVDLAHSFGTTQGQE